MACTLTNRFLIIIKKNKLQNSQNVEGLRFRFKVVLWCPLLGEGLPPDTTKGSGLTDTTLTLPTSKGRASALQKQDSPPTTPETVPSCSVATAPLTLGPNNPEGYCFGEFILQV